MCKNQMATETPTDPNNNIKSNATSGIKRCLTSIETGLAGLSLLYSGLYWFLRNSDGVVSVLARDDYCSPGEKACRRPDLIAYKVTGVIGFTIIGCMGMYNWYCNPKVKDLADRRRKASPEQRLFGCLAAADAQNVAILCYQVWDFVVSLTIPEFVDPVFLTHHLLAAATASFSLDYQMVTYYSVYFGGCTEFSSIFLALADLDEIFQLGSGGFWESVALACKGLFTLSFAYYRVIGWWIHSWPLWSDSLQSLKSGTANMLRPGKSFFLYVFLAMDAILGALQLYWFVLIIIKIAGMM